ncbi:RdgB/HAM1 family non-canonical purine NTP pyrophosphatase [Flavobacteriaceae bacterium]|jgi:XTP/dITP diphosphohydrolase|nr:RdgB/HAM1 family non-canonical purine NTP pyrophosphatase [Flavobacteriaceae bacterium]
MELIFATHNQNKVEEISAILPPIIEVRSLNDLNFTDQIPETSNTLRGNALIKARTIFNKFQKDCLADDTGLEVEILNGAPGVHSARFAGKNKKDEDNIDKLLEELKNHHNTNAQFRTIIALIYKREEFIFEGIIKGKIIKEIKGDNGFGYDSIFQPEHHFLTFAQISTKEKNKISHRAIALRKLIEFLKGKI